MGLSLSLSFFSSKLKGGGHFQIRDVRANPYILLRNGRESDALSTSDADVLKIQHARMDHV